jgi:hypothetical protein
MASVEKKNARTVPLSSRVRGNAFWDAEICILVDFLQHGGTVYTACYC